VAVVNVQAAARDDHVARPPLLLRSKNEVASARAAVRIAGQHARSVRAAGLRDDVVADLADERRRW
jgi:hypothetical protein